MPFDILEVIKESTFVTLIIILPPLVITMIIGLLVSVFQAVTQLQDQSLQFVPKLIVVSILLFFMFQYNFDKLSDLTHENFSKISNIKYQELIVEHE